MHVSVVFLCGQKRRKKAEAPVCVFVFLACEHVYFEGDPRLCLFMTAFSTMFSVIAIGSLVTQKGKCEAITHAFSLLLTSYKPLNTSISNEFTHSKI